jgi:hypothetical protein
MPSTATKYGGKTLTRTQLTFEDTDTITFYFRSDTSNGNYLGYYAECRGYDENNEIITSINPGYIEVFNDLTVEEMIDSLKTAGSTTLQYLQIPKDKITYYEEGRVNTSLNFDELEFDLRDYFSHPHPQLVLILRGNTNGSHTSNDCIIQYDGWNWTKITPYYTTGGTSIGSQITDPPNATYDAGIINVKLKSSVIGGTFQIFYM